MESLAGRQPEAFQQVQHSLEPYIKQRQEVERVRRILATHLKTYIDPAEACSRPLSIVEPTAATEAPSTGIRGIRRDYLRCIKANIVARQEYAKTVKEHQLVTRPENRVTTGDAAAETALDSFLDVVKNRSKHERLRIIQEYIDGLSQKPAAAPDHFDPAVVLKDAGSLPKVPSEVIDVSGSRQHLEETDLKELIDQLEHSVLRAKLLLKREQKLLAKMKAGGQSHQSSFSAVGSKLQALGMARNELISWIETELSKAGESTQNLDESQGAKPHEHGRKEYLERYLISIQRQYSQYTKARRALILAVNATPEPIISVPLREEGMRTGFDGRVKSNAMSNTMYPYLEELTSISNEQKSLIQQKSHLTTRLAKQLKEANEGLDRLADESHILPIHPMPSVIQQRNGTASFGEAISNAEKPDSSRRARAWVFASDAANAATKDDVSMKINEGGVALSEIRETLAELGRFLGDPTEGEGNNGTGDIWVVLDGNLGAIKSDE
jgi:hypothetical protein